jgi:hypothetical protein
MRGKNWSKFKFVAFSLGLILWFAVSYARAQETAAQLVITGTDLSSLPSIELQLYGIDGQGRALDLTQVEYSILHNNSPVGLVEKFGVRSAGTFTLFLIDIPTGVADQLPAIQDAIIQYASAPTMMEQVDSVAIYQVGEVAAAELLSPDTFYNSVRNVFAPPLAAETRVTALVDSMMGLLEQVDTLNPSPEKVASMVVITDGTDVVSTQHEPEDVARRAVELGIPIHTIWLDNVDLSAVSRESGQNYLADLSAATRGLSAQLAIKSQLTEIWNRIASFRDHARIRYMVSDLTGGTFPVQVSLADNRQVRAETTVTIVANMPSVVIDLPAESRSLTLPNLEEPVELRLTTTVSWLDGVERRLTAAQLIVNDTSPQSIPVENIADFTVEANNLFFGDNQIQIAVLDEQGLRATSPPLLLTINEGPTSLPDELEPAGSLGRIIGRILLVGAGLIMLAGIGFVAWRQGWLASLPNLIPRGRSGRSRPDLAAPAVTYISDTATEGMHQQAIQQALAFLDVLESVSRMPSQIALSGVQVRMGRSPSQTEIAFENDITVSRLHATLLLEGSHYRIFDEQSTSGTWVNEQQVPEYGIQLMDGDEIHLGAVHLRFRQPSS